MPLTDITNAVASRNSEDAGGGVKKTFARKNRPPSETTKSTPLAGLGPIASPEASTPSPSPDGQEDAPVAKERAQCAWLSRRRSSCIMPFRMQQNAEKVAGGGAARRKRADKKAQQRQAELQAFLLRMRQHYAEVDAYELVEEEEVEDDKQEDAGRKTGPVSAAAVRATAREKRVVPPVPEQRSSDAAASPPCQPAAAGADLRATTPWSGAATAADLRCRQEEDEEAGAVAAASSSSSPAQADSGACGSLDSLSDSNSPDVMPLDHAAAAQSQLLPQVAPAGRPSLAGRRSSVVIPADTRLSLSMAPGRPSLARRGSMAAPPLAEEGKEEKDDGGTRPSATLNPNRLSVAASGRASLAGPRHSLLISDKRMSLLPPAMAAGRKSSLLPGRPSMLPARQSLAPQPPLLLPEEEEEEEGSQAHPAKAAAAAQEEEEEEEETTAEEDADAAAVRDQAPALSPLQQLLQLCGQGTDAAAIPSMDALLAQHAEVARITKIGEGTYGEAYRYMNKVFKIVPIEGANWINNAPQKTAGEMHAEALIALTLSRLRCPTEHGLPPDNVTSAFVETMGVGVCRGSYSKTLSKAWRRWDKVHGSENDPVDGLPKDQHYFVLVMSDCGQDLEKYAVDGYDQARSLLLQTVLTLAVAEEAVEFEHRDMHWGNVMVAPAPSTTAQFTLRGCAIEVQTHGALTALIDFTASRLRTLNGDIAFCDLSADPELFEGPKGMVQFDSYRAMRKLIVGDDWSASCPQTNCVWVAYMAEVLAAEKGACMSAGEKKALRAFRRRVLKCAACSEVVWDELFAGLWLSRRPQQQC